MAARQGSQLCRPESRCPQTVVDGALQAICCLRLYLHCDTRHLVIKHGKTQHSWVGDSSPSERQSFLCPPDVARVFSLAKTQTGESFWGNVTISCVVVVSERKEALFALRSRKIFGLLLPGWIIPPGTGGDLQPRPSLASRASLVKGLTKLKS